jgi:hypothetical protein
MNASAVAKIFDMSLPWFRDVVKAGFVVKPINGDYDFQACAVGIVRYYQQSIENNRNAHNDLLKSRKAVADVDLKLKEVKLQQQRGELVPLRLVELVWTARKTAVRQRVEQLAGLSASEKENLNRELSELKIEEYLKGGEAT